MLRLIMQHEEPTVKLEPEPTTRWQNGSGTYRSDVPNNPPKAASVNLNFRVFEVDCPELEAALKASMQEGANVKKLVLLGMEIFDKPKPAIEPPKPVAAVTSSLQPVDPKDAALRLKEELKAKHAAKQKRWLGIFRRSTSESKPLPLPG